MHLTLFFGPISFFQGHLIFRQFSSLCIYRYRFWRHLLVLAAEPVPPLMGQKISGHTWSWPNLTIDRMPLKNDLGHKNKVISTYVLCAHSRKTHFANLDYLLTIRYVTWLAQVIRHDVPSPKIPNFLGISHIKPKVCPDIAIGICSLKLYVDIWANFWLYMTDSKKIR